MAKQLPRNWVEIRREWPELTAYQRFETAVAARVVILIALLAVVRKGIVVDLQDASPASLAALAGLVLCLGLTYWLIREHDNRLREGHPLARATAAPGAT